MKIIKDAKEMGDYLKGCIIADDGICICPKTSSIEIYFTNGRCICIEAALVPFIDVTPELEIEVRIPDEKT